MKFAILADIHGNSAALEAVLDDMDSLGVIEAANLGDHFSGPLDARGTAEILLSNSFSSIAGNHDRWLVDKKKSDMGPSDRVAIEQLNSVQIDWLRALTPTLWLCDEVFLCHGTPKSDLTYWLEKVDKNGTVRSAKISEIEREAEAIDAELILCAHTHIPRIVQLRDGRLIVNPGSVGCPGYDDDTPVPHIMQTGTPNASYAIAEKVRNSWLITFRSVPYDNRRMVEMAEKNDRPEWSRALQTGWVDE